MTGNAALRVRGGLVPSAQPSDGLTHVELTHVEKRIENWIRFGREAREQVLDRRRRVLSFQSGSIFAFVRWAANDFGTIISRIDIVRAVEPGEAYQTLPFVRPGGDILLKIEGWPKVEQVLRHIDAVEAAGIDACEVAPDHWRHVHNRMRAGEAPRAYTLAPSGVAPAAGGRRMTRFGYVMVTYFSVMGVAVASFVPTSLRFVWNASASAPIGLYEIEPVGHLEVTDLVAVMPPKPLADFMVERGYIGRGVPLMKRVMAQPGQEVCRAGHSIMVDGVPLGDALDRDRTGRALQVWQGCRRVADGELFLMNPGVRDSLDGRYFGPLPARAVIGRAMPLYTDEDDDGRFVWRAPTR